MQRLLDSGADAEAHSAEYAFVTVTVRDTDHKILLRLSDKVHHFKRRLTEYIPSLLYRDIRLTFDGRTLDVWLTCEREGLKQGSHVLCHLENQSNTAVEVQP